MNRAERDLMYEGHAKEAFMKSFFEGCIKENPIHREHEINNLQKVTWKDRSLVTIRCIQCGNDRNVPRSVLWCLISLERYRCPFCLVKG